VAGRKGNHRFNDSDNRGSRQLAVVLPILAVVIVAMSIYQLRQPALDTRDAGKDRSSRYASAEGSQSPAGGYENGSRVSRAPRGDASKANGQELAKSVLASLENALAETDSTAGSPSPSVQKLRRVVLEKSCANARKYLLTDPEDTVVRPALTELLLRLDKLAEAEQVMDKLLELAPESAQGLWLKGRIMRRRGKEGYMEYLRRAADKPTADARILQTCGQALLDAGQYKQAEKYLKRALQARRRANDRLAARDAQMLYGLGVIELRRNRLDRAAELLGEAAKLAPSDLPILLELLEALRLAGRHAQAAETLSDARGRFGKWVDRAALSMELGKIRRDQGKWVEAAEAFAQASGHPSFGAEAALQAAQCYYNAGRYASAMQHIDAAVKVRRDDPEALEWLSKIEDARFPRN
jgi:tetratricopeptide (TPR) repeat protein